MFLINRFIPAGKRQDQDTASAGDGRRFSVCNSLWCSQQGINAKPRFAINDCSNVASSLEKPFT
jgi:hypothetical protein